MATPVGPRPFFDRSAMWACFARGPSEPDQCDDNGSDEKKEGPGDQRFHGRLLSEAGTKGNGEIPVGCAAGRLLDRGHDVALQAVVLALMPDPDDGGGRID